VAIATLVFRVDLSINDQLVNRRVSLGFAVIGFARGIKRNTPNYKRGEKNCAALKP
jgi:hypothetical protein